ncbi:MAG TPA: hypothetical protein VK053_18560 [Jiangellaceae bacterium]|nr:hypothetical protein [Jiangellaceae bacterium]
MSAFTLIEIPGPLSDAPFPTESMSVDGLEVVRVEGPAEPQRVTVGGFVAQTALQLHRRVGEGPLALLGHGLAGPFLPALAQTQRVAGRAVTGYVFVDALLPRPGGGTLRELLAAPSGLEDAGLERTGVSATLEAPVLDQRLPPAPDWPDAPCGFVQTAQRSPVAGREFWARSAARRDWAVGNTVEEVLRMMPGLLA